MIRILESACTLGVAILYYGSRWPATTETTRVLSLFFLAAWLSAAGLAWWRGAPEWLRRLSFFSCLASILVPASPESLLPTVSSAVLAGLIFVSFVLRDLGGSPAAGRPAMAAAVGAIPLTLIGLGAAALELAPSQYRDSYELRFTFAFMVAAVPISLFLVWDGLRGLIRREPASGSEAVAEEVPA